jgi:nitrile hydratase beta subunit
MMNGIHDLGGMHGFGSIEPEPDERVFHEPWERRVFGMMMATFAGGQFNVDQFRHAIERMTPAHYLESSYYEHWLAALETLLVENGALTRDELEARRRALTKEVA